MTQSGTSVVCIADWFTSAGSRALGRALLTCGLLIAMAHGAVADESSPRPPAPSLPDTTASDGALLLVGGGNIDAEIWQRFVDLAGGPQSRIVVILTAKEQPEQEGRRELASLQAAGTHQITLMHTADRELASSAEFLAPLRTASGVWITGGRQWRLVQAYEGTPLVDACHQLLRRGGIIGGTSAGATIQGDYLLRGDPAGNTIVMSEQYNQGFAFLPGVAVDQHFTERKRDADLRTVKRAHPDLICLGIDESTALLVRGVSAEILGRGAVTIYDAPTDAEEERRFSARVLRGGATYTFPQRPTRAIPTRNREEETSRR